jgi:hypothetical protein
VTHDFIVGIRDINLPEISARYRVWFGRLGWEAMAMGAPWTLVAPIRLPNHELPV